MRTGFVTKIGPLKVERVTGCMRTNSAVDTGKPPAATGHTTEGSWNSAVSVFRSRLTAPQLLLERKRVGQCVPFGEMAATLQNDAGGVETNRWMRLQIEVVAFSKDQLWLPHAETVDSLAHIMVWSAEQLQIPIKRAFSDDNLGAKPWAVESYPRRRAGRWGKMPGWFMHVEAPENAHWDMGMYKWSVQTQAALDLVEGKQRVLILRTPFMTGRDVVEAEKLLQRNRFGNFAPGGTPGTYDLEVAQATWRAKWYLGYPEADVNTAFGPALKEYLEGKALPAAYKARRTKRIATHRFKTPVFTPDRDVHPD